MQSLPLFIILGLLAIHLIYPVAHNGPIWKKLSEDLIMGKNDESQMHA